MGFKELFKLDFSASCSAHARVNLIGEHTDYTGGFVLPSLLNFQTTIQISKNDTKEYQVYSENFNEIKKFPEKHNPKYKPNLSEEALLTFETGNGIKLSHYNLLVNANSIQKALNIKSRTKIYCNLEPNTSAWAVFKAILPIYSGCIFDKDNPDLSINTRDGNYSLRYDFKNLKKFSNNDIAICPENTAAISVGPHPIHLTDFFLNKTNLKLKGHSVMMGYLDQQLNNSSFKKDGFFIYFYIFCLFARCSEKILLTAGPPLFQRVGN